MSSVVGYSVKSPKKSSETGKVVTTEGSLTAGCGVGVGALPTTVGFVVPDKLWEKVDGVCAGACTKVG